jgi:DNA-binding XRE family transcriptional regulator
MKSDLDRHIERHLKDEEFRFYFEKAEAKRIIAQQITAIRKAQKLSQTQLAKAAGTKQQSIARLENPKDKRMPSLEFLDRVAKALGRKLAISLAIQRSRN